MGIGKGTGPGGKRPGAGRPKGRRDSLPRVSERADARLARIERLLIGNNQASQAEVRAGRFNDPEVVLQSILRRITEIERHLGMREKRVEAAKHTRVRPLGIDRAEGLFNKSS